MVRTLTFLFVAILMATTPSKSNAQKANLQGEHDITVGVLGIESGTVYLVDLSRRDPETNAPYLIYFPEGANYGLKIGRTYSAHLSGTSHLSIVVNGTLIHPKGTLDFGASNVQTWSCQERPSPEGGHWEWLPQGNGSGGHTDCKPGVKETVKWKPDKGSKQETARTNQQNIPACEEQERFHDTTVTVVTTVKPAQGFKWTMDDAPSFFAGALLDYLNKNTSNITFREASGVAPNFYLNVTMSQTR